MSLPTCSKPLGAVAPSRFERLLGCPARVAFEQAGDRGDERPSPRALLGLAVHRSLELVVGSTATVDEAWDQACEELTAAQGDPRGAPGARRARMRLERKLPALTEYIGARAPAKLLLEHFIESPDRTIAGTLDLVILGDPVSVVDYKSGMVETDSGPDPQYSRQLAIYAWLVATSLGIASIDAALFSLRQGLVPVDVSPATRNAVIASAQRARGDYNERVPGPQPAVPDADRCGRCPFATRCDAAWSAVDRGDIASIGWGDCVRGLIAGPVEMSTSGAATITVDAQQGTANGACTVSDIPTALATTLRSGSCVSLTRLALASDDPLALVWRDGISSLAILQ